MEASTTRITKLRSLLRVSITELKLNMGRGSEGHEREVAFSKICHQLGISEACRAVLVQGVAGLAGFEARPCVVTEWLCNGKRPNELTADDKKEFETDITRVAEQLGKWIAVDLHLGLADRGKLDNWAWSQPNCRLAAIDTESAFQTARVAEHRDIMRVLWRRENQERAWSFGCSHFIRICSSL